MSEPDRTDEEQDAEEAETPRRRRWDFRRWDLRHTITVCAVAVLVLAVGFAGWGGWSWFQASHDDSLAFGTARDAALDTGRREITTLNSIDYRHLDAGMHQWLEASTGPLHDALKQRAPASKSQVSDAKTSAKGSVLDAAVTQLDTHAGTAQLIASVSVTVTPADGKKKTERKRFRAGMSRVDGGWKLSSLTAIPVSGT